MSKHSARTATRRTVLASLLALFALVLPAAAPGNAAEQPAPWAIHDLKTGETTPTAAPAPAVPATIAPLPEPSTGPAVSSPAPDAGGATPTAAGEPGSAADPLAPDPKSPIPLDADLPTPPELLPQGTAPGSSVPPCPALLSPDAALSLPSLALPGDPQPRTGQPEARAFQTIDELESEARQEAIRELTKLEADHPDTLPTLIARLDTDDIAIKHKIIWILGGIARTPDQASLATQALLRLLGDAEASTRQKAKGSLLEITLSNPETGATLIPVLSQTITTGTPFAAQTATGILRKLGAKSPSALPALRSALDNPDFGVKLQAALALSELDQSPEAAKQAVAILIQGVDYPDPFLRFDTFQALCRLGPLASAALPTLLQTINSPEHTSRWYAATGLGRIGPEAATADPRVVPALIAALNDPDNTVQQAAALALSRLAPNTPGLAQAVPVLEKLLQAFELDVQINAAIALMRIDPAWSDRLPIGLKTEAQKKEALLKTKSTP